MLMYFSLVIEASLLGSLKGKAAFKFALRKQIIVNFLDFGFPRSMRKNETRLLSFTEFSLFLLLFHALFYLNENGYG